jgi:hypothetical protein
MASAPCRSFIPQARARSPVIHCDSPEAVAILPSSVIPALTVTNGVFLVIGSVTLVYVFDLNNPDLFTNSFFLSILSLSLTIFIGRVYDAQKSIQTVAA